MAKPPSVNEQIADRMNSHAIYLRRVEGTLRARIVRRLVALSEALTRELGTGDLTDFRSRRLERLLRISQDTIRLAYTDLADTTEQFLFDLARTEADITRTIVAGPLPLVLAADFVTPTANQLRSIVTTTAIQGSPARDLWLKQDFGVRRAFDELIRTGIERGLTVEQIRRRIIGGTEDGKPIVGLLPERRLIGQDKPVTVRQATTLARTAVQGVANRVQQQTYEDNQSLIKSLKWTSAFDGRTSTYCLARSNKLYEVAPPHNPIDHEIPWLEGPGKVHWNCRSTSIPITKSWAELGFGDLDLDDEPPGTRASMDGQVPRDMTMDQWVRGKPREFVEGLLGKGKADLFLSGKIQMGDLLDSAGNELTLEQLRQLFA